MEQAPRRRRVRCSSARRLAKATLSLLVLPPLSLVSLSLFRALSLSRSLALSLFLLL